MSKIYLDIDTKGDYRKQISKLFEWKKTLIYVHNKYEDIDNTKQIEAVNTRIAELELLMVIHPDG